MERRVRCVRHARSKGLDRRHAEASTCSDLEISIIANDKNLCSGQPLLKQNALEVTELSQPVMLIDCINVDGGEQWNEVQRPDLAFLQAPEARCYKEPVRRQL